MIKINNLTLTRDSKPILQNINIDLQSGENLLVIGPNGAGKTSLGRILAGDLTPSYGSQMQINDFVLGKSSFHGLRQQVGYISSAQMSWFENATNLLPQKFFSQTNTEAKDSETENYIDYTKSKINPIQVVLTGFFATYGVSGRVNKQMLSSAKSALEVVNIPPDKHSQEFGLLSDGEKRKVLLARSLINNPSLLVLDEPTQALDIPSSAKFLDQINTLPNISNLIYITHHLWQLPKNIHKVLLLKDGKEFKYGNKSDVLTVKNLKELFNWEIGNSILSL